MTLKVRVRVGPVRAIPADASERLQEWFGPITSQSPVDQAKADDAPAE